MAQQRHHGAVPTEVGPCVEAFEHSERFICAERRVPHLDQPEVDSRRIESELARPQVECLGDLPPPVARFQARRIERARGLARLGTRTSLSFSAECCSLPPPRRCFACAEPAHSDQ